MRLTKPLSLQCVMVTMRFEHLYPERKPSHEIFMYDINFTLQNAMPLLILTIISA
jgi:hypothetical protein